VSPCVKKSCQILANNIFIEIGSALFDVNENVPRKNHCNTNENTNEKYSCLDSLKVLLKEKKQKDNRKNEYDSERSLRKKGKGQEKKRKVNQILLACIIKPEEEEETRRNKNRKHHIDLEIPCLPVI
jgi:hypothetical protein